MHRRKAFLLGHPRFPSAAAAFLLLAGFGCKPASQSEQRNFCENRRGPTGADEVVATYIVPVPLQSGASQGGPGTTGRNNGAETGIKVGPADTGFCFYERIDDSDLRPFSLPLQTLIPGTDPHNDWIPLTSQELFGELEQRLDELLASKMAEATKVTAQQKKEIEQFKGRLGWVRHGPAAFATFSLMATVFFGQIQAANVQFAGLYAQTHGQPAPSLNQLPEYVQTVHAVGPFGLVSALPAVPIIVGAQVAGEAAASAASRRKTRYLMRSNRKITVEALEQLETVPSTLRLKLENMLRDDRYLQDVDELQTLGLVYQMFQAILVQKHLDTAWKNANQGRGYCPVSPGTALVDFVDRRLWNEKLFPSGHQTEAQED